MMRWHTRAQAGSDDHDAHTDRNDGNDMDQRMTPPWLLLLACTLLLAACGPTHVTVKSPSAFPQPLVEPLPVKVGVFFAPEFSAYAHHEERPKPTGGEWTISLGAPQTDVFRQLFSAVFSGYRELQAVDGDTAGMDSVIVPSVSEFQFALPSDTKSKIFEIWIKYDLSIRDTRGAEIGHWVFTAYGKTPTAFMTSDEAAIHAATLVALRDAGASMVLGLERDTQIRELLHLPPPPAP